MKLDFEKSDGLIPVIIQDASTSKVLMLGFMNQEALDKTRKEGKVTFFSRSRQTLWTKGETSGNYLLLRELLVDCDQDTILIKAMPTGPVCHTGQDTCFDEKNPTKVFSLAELEKVIHQRKLNPPKGSYTAKLYSEGINKIAQKVGEEATETIIEAISGNNEKLKEESADLLYHLLVLFAERGIQLGEVEEVLAQRHRK